nr:Hpt domain-containing protein [Sneathiella glossodoripedis]
MDDLLSEFLTETNENIGIVDAALVALEQNPDDGSQIDNIFRLVHTIKGTCGFLGLPRLEAVAHAGENVLGKIRDKELSVNPDVVTIILEAMDVIKDLLETLEQTEEEPEGNDADLIARLNAVAYGGGAAPADAPAAPAPAAEPSNVIELSEEVSEAELEAAFQAAEGPDDAAPEPEASSDEGLKPGEVSLDELEAAFQAAPVRKKRKLLKQSLNSSRNQSHQAMKSYLLKQIRKRLKKVPKKKLHSQTRVFG